MKRKPMKRDDEQPQPAEQVEADALEPAPSGALVEPAEEAVARLEAQLADLKDRHLRLAAEYDNFRKRTLKERSDLWGRAQADLVERLVDALDDLARFAHVDPDTTDARAIHDGIDMVERKVWKQLEASGVTRVDQVGVPFDPKVHEAVTTGPADHPAKDQTVGAVLQPGYRIGGQLIRPARVVVLTWQGERAERGGGGGDRATPSGPQGETR
ncbi:MAG TPA: nucleotide exchange factor GrpE [Gemmatimonadales bacterium]|nr:nucleotide exchange factor GrpE [Gemmatimonadales bacterium]